MFLQEYEKLRLLGKGAFASVFKVRHGELGYVRALKVSHEIIDSKEDKSWKTFLEECKMLLRIGNGAHPNIVRIYQPRLLENKAAVEMDYVDGLSLAEYIGKQKFISVNECQMFAKQIVGALAYCHVDIYQFMMDAEADNLEADPVDGRKFLISPEKEQELIAKYSVIHNDLHSNNIIRRHYDNQYILLDFGLSIQDNHCVKSSSRGDGAIEYTAPEKLDLNAVSTQSDVYALGILLYEMLTGRVPFQCKGNTPESARAKVYMQHLNETPPSLLDLRKEAFETTHPGETYVDDLPEGLVDIVMKCLSKQPGNRFQNAKELHLALNDCFDKAFTEQPQTLPPITPGSQSQPQATALNSEETKALLDEIKQLRVDVRTMHQDITAKLTETTLSGAATVNTNPPPVPPTPKKGIKFLLGFLWTVVFLWTGVIGIIGFDRDWDWYEYSDFYIDDFGPMPFFISLISLILAWTSKPKHKWLSIAYISTWAASTGLCSLFHHNYVEFTFPLFVIALFCFLGIHKLRYKQPK